jgi:hypothetical protein
MELQERIELAKTLLKIAELNVSETTEQKNEKLGKCIWIDLEGNKRCNSSWTEFQAKQVFGKFYQD